MTTDIVRLVGCTTMGNGMRLVPRGPHFWGYGRGGGAEEAGGGEGGCGNTYDIGILGFFYQEVAPFKGLVDIQWQPFLPCFQYRVMHHPQ